MVDHAVHHFDLKKMGLTEADVCQIFDCTVSGYHSWVQRMRERQNKKEQELRELHAKEAMVREVVQKMGGYVPGKEALSAAIFRNRHVYICPTSCGKLKKLMHLETVMPGKDAYRNQASTGPDDCAEENLVEQAFLIAPRIVILTDITYLFYNGGRDVFYLCVFKDAYTMEILGFCVDDRMDQSLVDRAYDDMMRHHGKELHHNYKTFIHSDHGSVYTSYDFKKKLSDDEFTQSMSAKACPLDNAPCESFYKTLKDRISRQLACCTSLKDAMTMVSNYIDFYNNKDYKPQLAALTPSEFYMFTTTHIYPCDDYFGVPLDVPKDYESVISYLEDKRKSRNQRKRESYALKKAMDPHATQDALTLVQNDGRIVKGVQEQYEKTLGALVDIASMCSKAQADIMLGMNDMEEMKMQVDAAAAFMQTLDADKRKELLDVKKWVDYPELGYSERITAVMEFKPLYQFLDSFMRYLTKTGHYAHYIRQPSLRAPKKTKHTITAAGVKAAVMVL